MSELVVQLANNVGLQALRLHPDIRLCLFDFCLGYSIKPICRSSRIDENCTVTLLGNPGEIN